MQVNHNNSKAVFHLLKELIRCPSITPNDAGCQDIISGRLIPLGFKIERMRFGEVDNLWATYGSGAPLFCFAGHTDVVPPGPLESWISPPFQPTEREGLLYGRGAADMKSGLAAMIIAVENFIKDNPDPKGTIAFLITSDEEGPTNEHGTKKVIQQLTKRDIKIDYCIIGEATSEQGLGDQIRIGRRGSLSGKLILYGKQGHIAFPHKAINPIHKSAAFLQELTTMKWDEGNDFFPPTNFQISNIHAGTGAQNVIPGQLELLFNFRYSTEMDADTIQSRMMSLLENHQLKFDLSWDHSGQPFLTKQGKLIEVTQSVLKELTGNVPAFSTGGGTSDGRFIAPTGAEVIELGPCNGSVHQANEHVKIDDLNLLSQIYENILTRLLI